MFNFGGFMEQMQKEFEAVRRRLQSAIYEGSARGGQIRARANGLGLLVALEISQALAGESIAADVLAACNAALQQARKALGKQVGDLTGGNFPLGGDDGW